MTRVVTLLHVPIRLGGNIVVYNHHDLRKEVVMRFFSYPNERYVHYDTFYFEETLVLL